ncbi:MAG: DUF3823 domain-containing protein [Bacteroidales bacterium]|nr:DUF3823 domain-containing protein [Bacteroidales bacterium]
MKKIASTLFILAALALAVSSWKPDTHALTDGWLHGKLITPDGGTLITEQPNGFQIRLNEIVKGEISTLPQDFWGKADGTFNNTKIFRGSYVVQPINGAFLPVDPVEIDIDSNTEIDFEVTPNCTIDADVTNSGRDLVARYRITKDPDAGKITKARVLVSKWNPNVGMNHIDKEVVRDLDGIDDTVIQKTLYTDTILDLFEVGVTYYVRIAALCENAAGRYNFSETFVLEM